MTETQYAAALAASAASTRRAWAAHHARMSAGIDVGRTKAPVIVAIARDLAAHPRSSSDEVSKRTGCAIRSVQDGIRTLISAGRVTAYAEGKRRVFSVRADT